VGTQAELLLEALGRELVGGGGTERDGRGAVELT
jgi:hypothetical protein